MPTETQSDQPYDFRPMASFWKQPRFTLSLISSYIDMYSTEGLGWQPTTIQMELEQDLGQDINNDNFNRLLVGIALLTSNSFYVSVTDFLQFCTIMSFHAPTTNTLVLPDTSDVAWGMTEGMLINPPDNKEKNPFSEEIVGYIQEILSEEGILNPPDVLRIGMRADNPADRVNYDWSDDSEMFEGIWSFEKSKSDHITKLIQGRLHALLLEVQGLPLKNGKTEFIQKLLPKFAQVEPLAFSTASETTI